LNMNKFVGAVALSAAPWGTAPQSQVFCDTSVNGIIHFQFGIGVVMLSDLGPDYMVWLRAAKELMSRC
jgi:hypothetical protein